MAWLKAAVELCGATGSRALSKLFWRDPVNLFLDRAFVGEASALQNRLAVLNHLGMAAQICVGIAGPEPPLISVFAQDVVGAPNLPGPVLVIPGPAHGWDILQPRNFLGKACQFIF